MPYSWIYILFITTAALTVTFAIWSLQRTRKSYKANNGGREPTEGKQLKERLEN